MLIGVASSGAHSNGFSLVRQIIAQGGHDLAAAAPFDTTQSLGAALLTPTRIYVRSLLPLVRAGQIKAMAHITGGGFLENIPRVLPQGARANVDAPALPALFDWLRREGNLAPDEMARTFNCGVGMVLAVAADKVAEVTQRLEAAGETVVTVGRIAAGEKGCTVRGSVETWSAKAGWSATHLG
jgi:phosphoribosylformylglycinamidine cyclo-ligase